jgi:WD40 repeat protein
MPQQTLFYCADEDLRQSGCFIYDPQLKEIIAEPEDISFLHLSADGMTAAFFNRTVNALFLYDLPSKTLTRKYPFQARGFPVNAVFSSDGKMFQYVIQNLNNASDLSVETLDAKTWKSYGRTSIRKAGVTTPTAFAESSNGQIWVFAGKSGEVWLLSPDKGVLLHHFQAHLDEIIGMALDPDGAWLLTMGENGILKFWGIEQ